MICPRCNRKLLQISGMWTPKIPNRAYRKYVCYDCKMGYTEVVDTGSHKVIQVDETSLSVKGEIQTNLDRW